MHVCSIITDSELFKVIQLIISSLVHSFISVLWSFTILHFLKPDVSHQNLCSLCGQKKKKIHKELQLFLISVPPKQYPLFPEETWTLEHNWNPHSTHLPTLVYLADFPAKFSSAKPKPHQQQQSLKVKAPDLKVGRWPDRRRGGILHCYFWVALVLLH